MTSNSSCCNDNLIRLMTGYIPINLKQTYFLTRGWKSNNLSIYMWHRVWSADLSELVFAIARWCSGNHRKSTATPPLVLVQLYLYVLEWDVVTVQLSSTSTVFYSTLQVIVRCVSYCILVLSRQPEVSYLRSVSEKPIFCPMKIKIYPLHLNLLQNKQHVQVQVLEHLQSTAVQRGEVVRA